MLFKWNTSNYDINIIVHSLPISIRSQFEQTHVFAFEYSHKSLNTRKQLFQVEQVVARYSKRIAVLQETILQCEIHLFCT